MRVKNNAPVTLWAIGETGGLTSKQCLLYALKNFLIEGELKSHIFGHDISVSVDRTYALTDEPVILVDWIERLSIPVEGGQLLRTKRVTLPLWPVHPNLWDATDNHILEDFLGRALLFTENPRRWEGGRQVEDGRFHVTGGSIDDQSAPAWTVLAEEIDKMRGDSAVSTEILKWLAPTENDLLKNAHMMTGPLSSSWLWNNRRTWVELAIEKGAAVLSAAEKVSLCDFINSNQMMLPQSDWIRADMEGVYPIPS